MGRALRLPLYGAMTAFLGFEVWASRKLALDPLSNGLWSVPMVIGLLLASGVAGWAFFRHRDVLGGVLFPVALVLVSIAGAQAFAWEFYPWLHVQFRGYLAYIFQSVGWLDLAGTGFCLAVYLAVGLITRRRYRRALQRNSPVARE